MTNRRQFLAATVAATLAAGLRPLPSWANPRELNTRPIPSTGERLPVIGMGTSGSFEVTPGSPERAALDEVLSRFLAAGASVIDTSPNYGRAEDVLGELMASANARPKVFLATKLATEGRDAGFAQFEQSLKRLRTDTVDLLQVHNLRDWRTQLGVARELKQRGKVRYVGVTHFLDARHDELAEVIAAEKPDFVQVNYSVAAPAAENKLLPLAQDLGVAVIVNRAFEDGRLFARVADRPLPGWAGDVGVSSWAQMFLKFALSHPAATVVIPATGKPHRQSDNLQAGYGPMLDAAQRAELVRLFA